MIEAMVGQLIEEGAEEFGIDEAELLAETLKFAEDAMLGGIVGLTAYFANECREGLMTTISGAFRLTENSNFLDPSAITKMSLAVTNLLEGVNVVTAYCDFSAMTDSISEIFNFEHISTDWTEYVVLAARSGGFLINDYWV